MDDEDIINETRPLIQASVNEDIIFAEPSGTCFQLFDPRRKFYRYFGLIFICLMCFGGYFCYVLPGALESELEKNLRISTTQFTTFTSLYSWPNIVLCFVGGYLTDRVLGIPLAAILFSCFVSSGQILFSLGAYIDKVWIMDIGRFIFGMGGESVLIAQKAYCVTWFSSDEQNLVFGLIGSIALLILKGSSINQIIMTPIYNWVSQYESGPKCLGIVLFIATIPCLISTVSAFILSPLDKRRKRILRLDKRNDIVASNEKIRLTDAFRFPVQMWFMVIICVCFYSFTFPFVGLAKLYLIRKYNCSASIASLQQSIFFLVTVITSPLFGIIVDRTGYNMLWVIGAIIMAIGSHLLFMFTFLNSFVPIILLGVSLSLLLTSLWPMVSLLVAKHQLGTAYGLMQSVQNLGLAIFSILTGLLLQNYGYFVLELFFLMLCLVAFISAIVLYLVDDAKGGILCLSKNKRDEMTL